MTTRYKGDELVCDVVAAEPATWAVFERHGMCSSCRSNPPQKPLSHFAKMHVDDDLDGFLAELHEAVDAAAH